MPASELALPLEPWPNSGQGVDLSACQHSAPGLLLEERHGFDGDGRSLRGQVAASAVRAPTSFAACSQASPLEASLQFCSRAGLHPFLRFVYLVDAVEHARRAGTRCSLSQSGSHAITNGSSLVKNGSNHYSSGRHGLESEWQRGWTSIQDLMNKSSSLISAKSAMSAAQEMPTSEAHAREQIDAMLVACRWVVQNFSALNLGIGQGIALCGRAAVARAREKHHDYEILETPSGIAFDRRLP